VLPPQCVNQIAAGEVVERPASVVKELVENALDAGARAISVEIGDGGLALVRVTDDGTGMEREDAVLSLERHATSKLRDASGLSTIATMGFRGEALPAIASVSRLRIDTCPSVDGAGTRVTVEGGRHVEITEVARARGTTVEVRDLFFNTPARRKFMRSPTTEAGHASEAALRLALARPDVAFTLRSAGRVVFSSPAGAPLPERVAVGLGREAHQHLLAIDGERGGIRVRGLACSPRHSEATSRGLYLFVNGRYVRDRGVAHAVLRSYAETLPSGRHPAAVLFLELPAGRVDVNVHPQKLEVRFADPRAVHDAVVAVLSEALRTSPWLRHQATAFAEGRPLGGLVAEEVASVLEEARALHGSLTGAVSPPLQGAQDRAAGEPDAEGQLPFSTTTAAFRGGYFASLRYIGQHARTYLVCEAPGGTLTVIDQHASHERLLFHRLREAFRARQLEIQPFLVPQMVTLPMGPARAIEARLGELGRLGLAVDHFGGETFAVKGAPALLAGVALQPLLEDLAQQLEQLERGSALDQAFHGLLATIACHSAVRANQEVAPEEARALLDGLDSVDFKANCPHGRPVVLELPLSELERKVGRR
jgi:DNA mismatch repair protein MutL